MESKEICINDLTNYLVSQYLPSVSEKVAKKFSDIYFIYNPYDPLEKNPELKFSLEEVVQKYFDDHADKSEVEDSRKYKNDLDPDDDSKLLNSIVYHYLKKIGQGKFAEKFRRKYCFDKDDDCNNNTSKISMEDVVMKYFDDHDDVFDEPGATVTRHVKRRLKF